MKQIIDELLAQDTSVSFPETVIRDDVFYTQARTLLLQIHDYFWMNHLDAMDHLRMSVGLRGVGQRDPLVEYKREGLAMFKELEQKIKSDFVRVLTHAYTNQG